jgi:hypothetical protein
MQNLSTTDPALVHIDFKKADGTSAGTWDGTIPANGSQFLYSGSISTLQTNSESAATISSDQPLAVIANMGSSGPKMEAAYSGVSDAETATTLFAPGVYRNYYNNVSNIRVQNVGGSKTCVRVEFFARGAATPANTQYKDILPGTGQTFTQADNTGLPQGFIGSATITSVGAGTGSCAGDSVAGQKMAAIVNINITPGPSVGNPTTLNLEGSYNAITSGGSVAYAPVLANNYYNNNSSLTVLNLRGTDQWVRVSFGSGTDLKVKEKLVAANSSNLWYTPNEGPVSGWFGGANVECISGPGGSVITDCDIAATVNQINTTGGFAAYNAFASATTKVSLPVANRRYAVAFGGFTTSITCQNVSSEITDVSLALTGGNTVPSVTGVQPNGKAFWYLNHPSFTGVAVGFNGSAIATASNPLARIVCIGQQNGETPTTPGDWLTTYNGIKQ